MLNHEKILRLLHQNASAVIDTNDEALAVIFAVAWEPSLGDDLPFGTAVFKGKQPTTPDVLLACLRQVPKLGLQLDSQLNNFLKGQTAVDQIAKLQGEVNDLKTRLSKYQEGEQEAAGPDVGSNHPGGPQRPRGSS